jgi:2-dehydropantoate 2-reductase
VAGAGTGERMKTVVVGLGAVGGLIAYRLARAGHEVSALARGATLNTVRSHGLRLTGQKQAMPVARLSDDARVLGPHDLVVIAVKGPALEALAPRLVPLMHERTLLLPAMNGVPWWFLRAPGSPSQWDGEATHLQSVDPHGTLESTLPLENTLGCVVHLAASQPEPGVVTHAFGERVIVGEALGGKSQRAESVAELLSGAGFQCEASEDIRREIWFKLWGNMTTNPVSALTGATADLILDDPLVRRFMLAAMAEAAAIGERIGCPIGQTGEERLNVTRQLGAFKTSMLQDAQAGRPLEINALIGAVNEIGERVGVPTPNIDALFGLLRLMASVRGLVTAA